MAVFDGEVSPFFLLMGEPNQGKTTIISRLLDATAPNGEPYELYVVDLDEQMHPYLKMQQHWGRVRVVRPMAIAGGLVMDGTSGIAYPKDLKRFWSVTRNLVDRWVEPDTKYMAEPYKDWPINRVMVWDSFRELNHAAIAEATRELDLYSAPHGKKTKGARYIQLKDYQPVAEKIRGVVKTLRYMVGRQFPIIFTTHVSHRTINISAQVTSNEIAEAQQDEVKKAELEKKVKNLVQVDDPKWSIKTVGRDLVLELESYFSYMLAAHKEANKIRLQTRDDRNFILRCNDPDGKLATYLPAATGLATVLDHHYSAYWKGGQKEDVTEETESTTEQPT